MIFSLLQKLKKSSNVYLERQWLLNNKGAVGDGWADRLQARCLSSEPGQLVLVVRKVGRLLFPLLCIASPRTPSLSGAEAAGSGSQSSCRVYRVTAVLLSHPWLLAALGRTGVETAVPFTIAFGNSGQSTVNGDSDANRREKWLYPYGELYKMAQSCAVLGLRKGWIKGFLPVFLLLHCHLYFSPFPTEENVNLYSLQLWSFLIHTWNKNQLLMFSVSLKRFPSLLIS